MREQYEKKNCQIAAVRSATGKGLEAFAKVTTLHASEDGNSRILYLNDVIARQHRRGMGSMALHAVLTKTNLPPDAILILQAFENSPVNEWYRRLSLEPLDGFDRQEFDFGNGCTLPLVYYGTPKEVGIGDVVSILEESHPNLAESRPV